MICGRQMVVRIVARFFGAGFAVAGPSVRGSAVGGSVGISIVSKESCASLVSTALEARKTDGRFLGSTSLFSQKFCPKIHSIRHIRVMSVQILIISRSEE